MSPPENAESRTGHDTGRPSRNFISSAYSEAALAYLFRVRNIAAVVFQGRDNVDEKR